MSHNVRVKLLERQRAQQGLELSQAWNACDVSPPGHPRMSDPAQQQHQAFAKLKLKTSKRNITPFRQHVMFSPYGIEQKCARKELAQPLTWYAGDERLARARMQAGPLSTRIRT